MFFFSRFFVLCLTSILLFFSLFVRSARKPLFNVPIYWGISECIEMKNRTAVRCVKNDLPPVIIWKFIDRCTRVKSPTNVSSAIEHSRNREHWRHMYRKNIRIEHGTTTDSELKDIFILGFFFELKRYFCRCN